VKIAFHDRAPGLSPADRDCLSLSPLPWSFQLAVREAASAIEENHSQELVDYSQAVVELQPWRSIAWKI